ncbi:hypothetical protein QYE76_008043 [Lolium multiflorum]|uniref:Transposon protein, putative, CACTA, En/Spm sub-class n=1 Tax=Lolium multiflorum TaxID=4521 RepID=A0AAD8QL03_LOLMU|nr:hypothetical protein QYE76_008043 [Lolium multiflorum]
MENYSSSWEHSGDEDGGGDGSGVDGEAFGGTSPLGSAGAEIRPQILLRDGGLGREGVNSFLLVAEANKSKQGFMCCPCLKCKNEKDYSCSRDIKSHLLRFGFMSSYNVWTKHGEEGVMMEDGDEEEDNDDQYRSMFSECFDTAMDDNEEEGGEEQASDDPVDDDLRRAISDARRDCGTDKERLQFDKMYEINGIHFTIDQDKKSTNQNSGVRFDAKDENGQTTTYYGYIEEIWELDYGPTFKVPLFRCKWVKLSGIHIDDKYGMITVDPNNLACLDEPFVLAKGWLKFST